jgi:SAM-dependent methyltransferase
MSRRGLFNFGLGRLIRDLDAEEAPEPQRPPPGPLPPRGDHPELRARLRAGWERCDGFDLWAPVAEALVEAALVIPGERLLDCGCGDGAVAIAAAGRRARVSACDDAPALLERGRERATAAELQVHWRHADAADLPYADEAFDTALSAFGAQFSLDTATALAELFRVTTSGGTVGVAAWTRDGVVGRLLALAAEHDPPPAGIAAPPDWGDEERLLAEIEPRADGVETDTLPLTLEFDSRDDAVQRLLHALGPLAAAHAIRPLDAEVRAIVDDEAGPGEGPVHLPASALIVAADRA